MVRLLDCTGYKTKIKEDEITVNSVDTKLLRNIAKEVLEMVTVIIMLPLNGSTKDLYAKNRRAVYH